MLTCMFLELGPVASSESELTSETVTPIRHFSKTSRTGECTIARPLPYMTAQCRKTRTYIIHTYIHTRASTHIRMYVCMYICTYDTTAT
jgi:hypothetical protein